MSALGAAIAATVTLTGIDLVLVGGGLAQSGETLLAPLAGGRRRPADVPAPPPPGEGGARRPRRVPRGRVPGLGRAVILTVTLNAALDITYDVDELVPHRSHRVAAVRQRAGGKGVNVASVLAADGPRVRRHRLRRGPDRRGPVRRPRRAAGSPTGSWTAATRAVPSRSSRRRTATPRSSTSRARWCRPDAWTSLVAPLGDLVREHGAGVVVSRAACPAVCRRTRARSWSGSPARSGARASSTRTARPCGDAVTAGPEVVKPNRHELLSATGCTDIATGVGVLRSIGARDVVVSDGADGLLVFPRDGRPLRARLPAPLAGNPTGAGDALVAALAAGLDAGDRGRRWLSDAVAWSAAAVLQPVAGEVDPDDVARPGGRRSRMEAPMTLARLDEVLRRPPRRAWGRRLQRDPARARRGARRRRRGDRPAGDPADQRERRALPRRARRRSRWPTCAVAERADGAVRAAPRPRGQPSRWSTRRWRSGSPR